VTAEAKFKPKLKPMETGRIILRKLKVGRIYIRKRLSVVPASKLHYLLKENRL
jgi:hypothetical protein